VAILRIEDRDGNVLYEYNQPESRQILAPELAYLMTDILSDRQARWAAFGYPNSLELPGDRPAAAKTGTTNDFRDAWTVGYTPQLAAGVWVGNSDNSEMEVVAGSTGAAPIWRAVMEYALHDEEIVPFLRPPGLVETEVCAVSGKLPAEHCPTVTELFVPGTEPTEECTTHQSFLVNRETGLLCTVFTPPELCDERVYEVYPPEAADWINSLPEENRPPTPPTEYDTIWGPSPTNADVAIIEPMPYAYVREVVPIVGNAKGGNMNFYRVRFGEGLYPTEWIQIGPDHGNWVDHSVLEYWDTTGLDGLYSLNLSVVDHSMAVHESTIQVIVDNISPTLELTHPEPEAQYVLGEDEYVLVNAEVDDKSVDYVEFYFYREPDPNPPPGQPPQTIPEDLEPFQVRSLPPFNCNWILDWDLEEGEYTFYAVAYDAAGNVSESERVTIKVVFEEEEEP
jgi:hypothetical protein